MPPRGRQAGRWRTVRTRRSSSRGRAQPRGTPSRLERLHRELAGTDRCPSAPTPLQLAHQAGQPCSGCRPAAGSPPARAAARSAPPRAGCSTPASRWPLEPLDQRRPAGDIAGTPKALASELRQDIGSLICARGASRHHRARTGQLRGIPAQEPTACVSSITRRPPKRRRAPRNGDGGRPQPGHSPSVTKTGGRRQSARRAREQSHEGAQSLVVVTSDQNAAPGGPLNPPAGDRVRGRVHVARKPSSPRATNRSQKGAGWTSPAPRAPSSQPRRRPASAVELAPPGPLARPWSARPRPSDDADAGTPDRS